MQYRSLSRRDFLKLGAAATISLAFRDFPPGGDPSSQRPPAFTLGRVIYSLRYYEQPTLSSKELGYYTRDAVINIFEEKMGDIRPTGNPLWLRTNEGWLNSAYVQPVENKLNTPVLKFPGGPSLVEVSVPFTQGWRITEKGWKRSYRFYYSSTYWAHYAFSMENGKIWYQLWDERLEDYHTVQAEHLRIVTPDELTPIAQGVSGKRIEVDLNRQKLVAYESHRPVFATQIATGYYEGNTPRGEFQIERKQPTRHMAAELDTDFFDLPGVPWVCYIIWTGVSLHGTYWHNNYGKPQSHGCINLPPQAAKWIYRWTEPFVPYEEDMIRTNIGTPVTVF
jgi:hypothetical protein